MNDSSDKSYEDEVDEEMMYLEDKMLTQEKRPAPPIPGRKSTNTD